MKIALVNDTHFGARGDSQVFNQYFFKFWENIFFPYLKENNITTLIHLGDVVDRRKFINHNTASDFQNRFMKRLWAEGIDTHIMIGNHDTYYKNTNKVNAIHNLCSTYDGIHEPFIYTDPKIVTFDGVDILLMPWICEDNYEQSMEFLKTAPVEVVFGHFEIAGFEMDRGNICHEGLDRKLFDRFDIVLSGHFHHKSTSGNITYLGNQYEMTWADYNDPRGFHVFDTETRETEFILNPHKMFHKIMYDDSSNDFEVWKKYNYAPLKDCFVKVVVLNKQNPFLFDSVLDNIYKAGVADLSIVEDFTDTLIDIDQEIIDQAEDTMTILSKYIDNLTLNVEGDKLKTLMRELYVEALNTEKTE